MARTAALRKGSQNELRRNPIRGSSVAFIRHSSCVPKTNGKGLARLSATLEAVTHLLSGGWIG